MNRRSKSQIGAVILAAGRSARMGEAKQLLRLADTTVLGRTLENVRGAGLDEVILVLGHSAESIQQQIPDTALEGVKVIVNPDYDEGMASSLRAGVSALQTKIDAALIVLADQPFTAASTLTCIVQHYRNSNARIVIPTHNHRRGNPVILDRSVFDEVMVLKGDIGFRAIFGNHEDGILKVELDDPGILLDIDDPDDYQRLRAFERPGS